MKVENSPFKMLIPDDNVLPRSSPERQGIPSAAILDYIAAVERHELGLHSFMLLRHGYVVSEGWWSPYQRHIPHILHSLTKGFTSTAVGLAIAEGLLAIDDPVISFFPEETPAEVSDNLLAMTVRHLLLMATGHDGLVGDAIFSRLEANWAEIFLSMPVGHEPGNRFQYDDGRANMLAAIIQKATGMKLIDYLQPRLFAPLGIKSARWLEQLNDTNVHGGYGLNLITEDIARFGQLYLQKGVWQGQRILPTSWIAEATTAQIATQIANESNPDSDWEQGYGYYFWRCRHHAYRADGAYGQFCLIMPDQDAVLAITAGSHDLQKILDMVWKHLLPAMGPEPLAEDTVAQEKLAQKSSALLIPPVEGQMSSPLTSQISGRTYHVEPNKRQITAITLDFSEAGCFARFQTPAGEETIPCGFGEWRYGQTNLFENLWDLVINTPTVAASGAWVSNNCFQIVVQLVETPVSQTVRFDFGDNDTMNVEMWADLSIAPLEPRNLTAFFQP